MNKTAKKLNKIERKLYRLLYNKFKGIKNYNYLGNMYEGHLFLVISAKETRKKKDKI